MRWIPLDEQRGIPDERAIGRDPNGVGRRADVVNETLVSKQNLVGRQYIRHGNNFQAGRTLSASNRLHLITKGSGIGSSEVRIQTDFDRV